MCDFYNNSAETVCFSALHLYGLFSLTVGSIWTMYPAAKAVVKQTLVCILVVNKDMLQKEVSIIIM